MTELKSCPFCGNNTVVIRSYSLGRYSYQNEYYAACPSALGCGARTKSYDTPEEAAEVWNRRDDDGKVH